MTDLTKHSEDEVAKAEDDIIKASMGLESDEAELNLDDEKKQKILGQILADDEVLDKMDNIEENVEKGNISDLLSMGLKESEIKEINDMRMAEKSMHLSDLNKIMEDFESISSSYDTDLVDQECLKKQTEPAPKEKVVTESPIESLEAQKGEKL